MDSNHTLCVQQSGLLGLAGNADLRSVVAAADSGDDQASLAIEAGSHDCRLPP
jgi:acetate kinase